MPLKELVHEFQILDYPTWQRACRLFLPDLQVISAVTDFAAEGAAVDIRYVLPGQHFYADQR